uniref:Uncharacterized protein n=1 Tax=Tanacetum cinerariifolium TaxID=118510 RepID=A0A6L2JJQ1_TANCI|nr:hypothetical protein [Tanacetum cinerariifolium]
MEVQKQQYLDEKESLSNQIQIKDYRNERIDIRYKRECEIKIDELMANINKMSNEINKKKELLQLEQIANLKSTIPLNEISSQIPPSIAITPVLPTNKHVDTLIIGNEELSTIPEKESDEFINSSVKDLVPIPSESKVSSESDDDEPSKMIEDQKLTHHLSGNRTSSSDHVVLFLSPSLTPTGDSDSTWEGTDTFLPIMIRLHRKSMRIYSIQREISVFWKDY